MAEHFPVEPYENSRILKPHANGFKFYFGMNKWGAPGWFGNVYPPRTPERDFLKHYVQHFNGIELNATHYQEYTPAEIKKWADKAEGKDFLFCPKVPQKVSHYSDFTDCEKQTKLFIQSFKAFGLHLGPYFLQVSNRFKAKKSDVLFSYLKSLPVNLQVFLEVRNTEWFEGSAYKKLLKFLSENGIGLIIADDPERILKIDLTIPKCFIRYAPTGDFDRLKKWYDKITQWQRRGLQEAYFFFQVTDGIQALKEYTYFKELVMQS